jgi:hypothetical protein
MIMALHFSKTWNSRMAIESLTEGFGEEIVQTVVMPNHLKPDVQVNPDFCQNENKKN